MILQLALALQAVAPPRDSVHITTPRGDAAVPISYERGAAVAAPLVAGPLDLAVAIEGGRATVVLHGAGFVFAYGSPYARIGTRLCQLVDESYVARDTLFLPLAWLADCVPAVFAGRFHWDAENGRLSETGPAAPAVASADPPLRPPLGPAGRQPADSPAGGSDTATPVSSLPSPRPPGKAPPVVPARGRPNPITGLRLPHVIVIDPGHGGRDPGNPGRYFPQGMTEKDVNLSIGKLLRDELANRGIGASLTRTGDTLIDLHDRAGYCHDDCDLFVSIHVNSMPDGKRSAVANGVETYFLSDAKTEDQRRVARMENDASRFESPDAQAVEGGLATILKDLRQNEYLRESARLAELVQQKVARIIPGDDRGVQQAGFYVLNSARRPAILVETGFSTNKSDGAFLASSAGQRKIADAIADGIVNYLLEFERKVAIGGSP
ncbi:MAG TPA: N-acetylmuramoyl-L-alanine amidase [Gemmatimonadales bacterium]|nr:N-acetylmuramoyl-L-alanine amidase [Gemmatimonadales bacterium]